MRHYLYWLEYQKSIVQSLASLYASGSKGVTHDSMVALDLLCQWAEAVRDTRRTMHFVGNGASACMASHMALDWTKNAGVKALAYNGVASLTAIGNDLGYDQVFAQPLAWFGEAGDLLVTISSSGNSPSILKAIKVAREKGMKVVTFSGMKPENASRKLGDLNFFVPGWSYGIVECAHQILLHAWLDRFMGVKEWELAGPQVIIPPSP